MPPAFVTPRLDRRMVLAEFFGCDYADLSDARYQSTRFVRIPVWTEGDDFWCVTKPGEKPPVERDCGFGPATARSFDVEWIAMPTDVYPLNSRYAGRGLMIWRVAGSKD